MHVESNRVGEASRFWNILHSACINKPTAKKPEGYSEYDPKIKIVEKSYLINLEMMVDIVQFLSYHIEPFG